MTTVNRDVMGSFRSLAWFFVIWMLVPAGLGLLVVRQFEQLSKHDLLTVLLLCLVALVLAVGGGMVMVLTAGRRKV